MERACVCEQYLCCSHVCVSRVTSLSCQRSLMPPDPGRRLDGITGNWIVFHLLWKQPGRDTHSSTLPTFPPLHLDTCSEFSPPHPFSGGCTLFLTHYEGMSHRASAFTCHPKFPLPRRNAGLDVSRVLNKTATCTISAAEMQHRVVHHRNGVEQYP